MKTVKIIAVCFIAVTALTACGTRQAARDNARCMGMGFEKGTPYYLDCRRYLDEARAQDRQRGAAARKALGNALINYGNSIRPRGTTCYSSYGASSATMTCY